MKQVLITLGILLAVMLGYFWLNGRELPKKELKSLDTEKQLFFVFPENVTAGQDIEVPLKAKYTKGVVTSFEVGFNYDVTMMKILGAEINGDVFGKNGEVKIDENFGKVSLAGEGVKDNNDSPNGEVVLATLKLKGLKKGSTMVYSSSRPQVRVISTGEEEDGNFVMPSFKVNFL